MKQTGKTQYTPEEASDGDEGHEEGTCSSLPASHVAPSH